jgi:tRNA A-37 threonylcarbamoyl transferase component Bud32
MRVVLDYVLERPIGAGDGTVVYRARRLPGDELVAIKLAAPDLTPDELDDVEQRLRREAEVLQQATHPAIVPFLELIDGGIDPGEGTAPVGLVLGLATRGSLRDLLSTGGALTPGEAVDLGVALAGALAALHAAGVVHGDISTGNVLLDDDRGPWLADLGDAGTTTRAARARGTEGFVAPEVVAGQPTDAAADIHALGRVLQAAALHDRDHDDPAEPSAEILARACDADPARRPTAAALALELARVAELAGAPPSVGAGPITRDFGPPRFPGLARPAPVAARSRRWAPALAVVGCAFAATVTLALITRGADGRSPDRPVASPAPIAARPDSASPPDASPCPGTMPSVAAGAVAVAGDPTGRGCLVTITWWPDRAEAERPVDSGGRMHFAIGDPGDQLLLGDWDDDGRDTPALYRPSTGQVIRFDGWADTGRPVTGAPVAEPLPRGGLARVERRAGGDQVAIDAAPGGT